MLKKDYFLSALRAGKYSSREWVLRCFTVVIDKSKDSLWDLEHREDGVFVKVPSSNEDTIGKWIKLKDVDAYEIPFIYHEKSGALKKGDLININRDIADSTWGVVLLNATVLTYATKDKIPFMEGPFGPKDIEKIFIEKLVDTPKGDVKRDPEKLYVDEWLKVGKAVGYLDGFEIFIPSITEKSLQAYPDLEKDKKALFDKYSKEELSDPVIQTKIQNELVAKQKEFLKGDVSEGFLAGGKTWNTAIKRMFLIHGPEAGFSMGRESTLVPGTLDKGIDPEYYVDMVNSLRAGSYYRGAMTALAGADVDLMARVFQNSLVQDKFCGTKDLARDVVITDRYKDRYILVKGERIRLTNEVLGKYIGTKQDLYDPCYCKASENDLCHVCVGEHIAAYKTSLGSAVAEKQSVLMYVMMSAAHAKELKTKPLRSDWLT